MGEAGPGGFDAFGFDSLEELNAAVDCLIEPPPEIRFCPALAPAYSVPEAFAVAMRALKGAEGTVRIRCVFASERAKDHVARLLPAGARPSFSCRLGRIEVQVGVGNIAHAQADAIVNASNTRLVLGGGVSAAIRQACSNPQALQSAMLARAPIEEGQVVATGSWLANAGVILHAATASGGTEVVRRSLSNVLKACEGAHLDQVAIPALGCGTGGLGVGLFGELAREALMAHEGNHPRRVSFVLFDAGSFSRFCQCLPGGS